MSSRWTNKLISKAAKLSRKDSNESGDGNVNDFLYGTGGPPPPRPDTLSSKPPPPRSEPGPKLDLEDNDNGLGEPLPPENPAYALAPVRRNKGLKVDFTSHAPVLIGEGGDDATIPVADVLSHANALKPLPSKASEPPVIVETDHDAHRSVQGAAASQLNRAPTKKPTGPGFLQKRRSFNMEEGMIQRQSAVIEPSDIAPRQGFGASLDPASAHNALPPAEAPPPPSAQMDSLKHRQNTNLPGILRAAAGNVVRASRSRSTSPAAKKWDELLSHPDLRKQKDHNRPQPQPVDQRTSPPKLTPSTSQTDDVPSDAFGGESASLHRGSSPNRAAGVPTQTSAPVQASPIGSEHSGSSTFSNNIDKILASNQQLSLADELGKPSTYKPTGMEAPEAAAQRSIPTTGHAEPSKSQQPSRPFQVPRRPSAPPRPDPEVFSSELRQQQQPPPSREPRLPRLASREQLSTSTSRPSDLRQPTLPPQGGHSDVGMPPASREPRLPDLMPPAPSDRAHRPSAERGQRPVVGNFSPYAPQSSGPNGEFPSREGEHVESFAQFQRRAPPPPLEQSFGSHSTESLNRDGGDGANMLSHQGEGIIHEIGERSPINQTTNHVAHGLPSPRHPPPHAFNQSQENLSRKLSKEPLSASSGDLHSSRTLDVPHRTERSASVGSHAESYVPPRLDASSSPGSRSPVEAQPSIPLHGQPASDVQPPHPHQSAFPASGPPVSSVNAAARSERQVYKPTRASTADDFQFCVDALAPAFTQAEAQARTIVRPKVFLWLRLASWWNLKGRKAFESKIKAQMERGGPQSAHVDETLLQPFVDAAKAWWITERILPELMAQVEVTSPSEPGGLEGRDLQQIFQALKVQIETFISSVTRRRLLPSPALLTVDDVDTGFLVNYPSLPAVVRTVTAGFSPGVAVKELDSPPFFSMILADDHRHFSYGHLFAEAQVSLPGDHEGEDSVLPCVVSLIRERNKSQFEITIASQDGQVDIYIKTEKGFGPTWKDVDLRTRSHSLRLQLMQDLNLVVRFEKEDFKTLWGMRDYNRRVLDEWMAYKDERLVFATQLHDLAYQPAQGEPSPLPTSPIRGCGLRLYEKCDLPTFQENGQRVFNGHRLVIMSGPESKTLSNVNQVFDSNFPILHNYLRGEEQRPALMIHFLQKGKPASIIPAFLSDEDRMRFVDKLSSSYIASDEMLLETIPAVSVAVSTSVPGTPANLMEIPGLEWQDITVVTKAEETAPFESGRFRVTSHSKIGSLVDRPVMQPGENKIGLDTLDLTSIRLRRPAQSSLVLSLMENSLPPGLAQPLQDAFAKKATAASTMRYKFPTLQDLHKFQSLVTGFEVLYDGVCNLFSIKGQRTVGGVHKRLEATRARLQLVRDKSGFQLLAFFKDMPSGSCMSFGVTSTDVFEVSTAGHRYFIRCVDAKFGVPKALSEPDATFVSLDLPEFAGERDDIMIGFDKEEDRSRLSEALPAPPSKASGLSSLKRFVDMGRPGSRGSVH